MGFLQGDTQAVSDPSFGASLIPNLPTSAGPSAGSADQVLGNFLQQLTQSPSSDVGAPSVVNNSAKSRRSVIDVIGRLADGIAEIGGSKPQYQPYLDARQDRARQLDMDEMKRKLDQQKLEAGGMELDAAHVEQVGQAARGLKTILARGGKEGVMRAWPLLAQQLKIPDDQKALFGQALAENPEDAINALDAAVNPRAQVSMPRELQIYKMLQEKDPALAEEYISKIADPKAITDYQQQQLQIQRDRLAQSGELGRGRLDIARQTARDRAAAVAAKAGKTAAGTDGGANFSGLLQDVRQNYDNLDRAGGLVHQGGDVKSNVVARARASGLGQLVEGALGTEAQTYRDNIKNSRPALVQAIKAATGMTAKQLDSNADMKLALQQATDPTQSRESNRAALDRLERMVGSHRPAAPAPRNLPAPRGGRRSAPASSGGWKVIGVQ